VDPPDFVTDTTGADPDDFSVDSPPGVEHCQPIGSNRSRVLIRRHHPRVQSSRFSLLGHVVITRNHVRKSQRNSALTHRLRAGRVPRVEQLENRRLLAANLRPALDLSQLEIDATSYNDSSIIVRYRSQDAPVTELVGGYGPTRTDRITPIGFDLHQVQLKQGVPLDSMLEFYQRQSDVLYAEPDYQVRVATIPNDSQFSDQWALDNTGQLGGTVDADIDAPEAWDLTTGTGSTVVAVIDTGVDYLHPDLAPNIWTNPGEIAGDGIDNDGNGFVDDMHGYDFFNDDADPMDDNNHGTHVAGTIGAEGDDGFGIAGINWGVQIMAVKFLGSDGSGSTSDAIAAVQYAVDNGAHISNNSWGGDPYSQAMYDVIADAAGQDHIFVAAAGNGNFIGLGVDNDATPFYPASYDLDNIVAVAATDRNDQIAVFSNYGLTSVDIGAPGVDILSTLPGGGHGNSSGTSMATPHVTGVLSLVRDFEPTLSPQQIIDKVLLSADPINALQGVTVTGARLNLLSSLVPDTFGPQVADVQPGGLQLEPFSSLRISFNESIDATTFTLADIDHLSGPQGDIPITSFTAVDGSNDRQFDITFATQSDPGEYELVVLPGILDRFGNVMDQNDNGVGGESPGDEYTYTIVKADAVAQFDFGTTLSPVQPGYTQITHQDAYSAGVGYGWDTGSVYSLSRGGSTALTADVNYTTNASFAVDLPNGEYDVIVTLGDHLIAHDLMGVFLEGVQVDSVSTAGSQFVANTYRTSVSDGQLTLGLTDLGGSDSYVMINGLNVVFAGPDLSAPSVISTDATGTVTGPIDRVTVSFNEPMDASSFTLADVAVLEGPEGAITPTAVNHLGAGDFEITFDSQSAAGEYRLVIGPAIADVGGNAMDQDGDGTGGETSEDQFETTFTLEAGPVYVGRFDFGDSLSPVAVDYTQVTGSSGYDAALGYGWQSGPVYSVNRGGDDLSRDLNYTRDATFAVDVANGEYDIVVRMGEALIGHDLMGVLIEGTQVDSVTTAPYEIVVNTYRTSISDGQLNLQLDDLGGSNVYAVINGLDVVFVGPDLSGPRVLSTDAAGSVTGPIDHITLTFTESIDASTLTLADVTVLEGPDGPITPTGVNQVSAGEFEVTFDAQNNPGDYRLVVGPDITDVGGNSMDQDGDGIQGEVNDDQFETLFSMEAGPVYVGRFDFGTTLSPVAPGYTGVTSADGYDAATGHGWQTGPVYAIERGGDPLSRDLNYTPNAIFAVDVANGEYDIVLTMGEALLGHDLMGIFVEGTQVDTVTTAAYETVVKTYRTSISDGQLNLQLDDLGGSNSYAVINGLDVVFVGPDLTGPSVISSDASGTVTGPIDRIAVTFNESIDASSFTLADVAVLEGPSGPITPSGIHQVSGGEFEVTFAPLNDPGTYRLVVGPDIADVGGNSMDQDADGLQGEAVDDQFETLFTLNAGPVYVGRFDFGTTLSPIATDYTGVISADGYDAAKGYGWQTGPVYAINRGGSDLTRDLNYMPDATFAVDVANGEYDVVITMGEFLIAHDLMGIIIEGTQVDTVSTGAFQTVVNTYRVTVSDGQLTLRLDDQGGSNNYAIINGLDVIAVATQSQSQSVMAADLALRDTDFGSGL
jgi:subtilisin family serine protease/fibronectin type 3 domain-containing protein